MEDFILRAPKGQKVWVQYPLKNGFYVITSNEKDRSKYFLYEIIGEKWAKIAQNASVTNLEKRILGNHGK